MQQHRGRGYSGSGSAEEEAVTAHVANLGEDNILFWKEYNTLLKNYIITKIKLVMCKNLSTCSILIEGTG